MDIKAWMWEMTPKDEDNIKHDTLNSKVNMVSVSFKHNDLSLDEEPHPKILDTLKSKLQFKGNIRLSESGKSYNLFRDELEQDNDLVVIQLEPTS